MIPLKDYNPTRRFPVITLVLIAINVGVYFFVQRPFDGDADTVVVTVDAFADVAGKGDEVSRRERKRFFADFDAVRRGGLGQGSDLEIVQETKLGCEAGI